MLIARSTEIHSLLSICHYEVDRGGTFSFSGNINAQ